MSITEAAVRSKTIAGNTVVSFNAASILPARDKGSFPNRDLVARAGRIEAITIGQWKKRVIEGVWTLFTSEGAARRKQESEPDQAELYEQVGRLKMQLEWPTKKVAQVE